MFASVHGYAASGFNIHLVLSEGSYTSEQPLDGVWVSNRSFPEDAHRYDVGDTAWAGEDIGAMLDAKSDLHTRRHAMLALILTLSLSVAPRLILSPILTLIPTLALTLTQIFSC